MVLIMLKALLILEILVRVVFDQYCLKHGIEINHRFYDLKLKCCSSSCCRTITMNIRQSEQKILSIKIHYFCLK